MCNHNSQTTHSCQVSPEQQFVVTLLHNILGDSYKNLPSYKFADYTRDKATIERRVYNEGIQFATLKLPLLAQEMLNLLEQRDTTFPHFALMRGSKYPNFLRGIFDVVCNSSDEATKGLAIQSIYMIGSAFKKLKGPYKTVQLQEQFKEFVDTDKSLEKINLFEPDTFAILQRARKICASDFHQVTMDGASPRPGPGATATKCHKSVRYEPHTLYKQHDRVLNYQEYFYITPWHAIMSARSFLKLHNEAQDEPSAKFIFVPKTFGKARGICAEENETQVLQQAVASVLRTKIKSSYLLKHLQLNDQSFNANAALSGSATRDTGTIDMSEASDRISRDLVAWIFQDVPLYEPLMALSTKWVIPPIECTDRTPIKTLKYAPMGSGLCFPVMSLIHFYLIRAIAELHTPRHRDLLAEVLVYGDDLIVPSTLYGPVTELLPKFGMKLNLTKSYCSSAFRESCGIHAYNGMDITPVYLKYTPSLNHPETCVSLLAAENLFFNKGYELTAAFLRQQLFRAFGITEYVTESSPMLAFKRNIDAETALNNLKRSNVKRRWDAELQCYEYRLRVATKATQQHLVPDDNCACLRWHWQKPEEPRLVNDSVDDHKIVNRWVSESSAVSIASASPTCPQRGGFPSLREDQRRSNPRCLHRVEDLVANILIQHYN